MPYCAVVKVARHRSNLYRRVRLALLMQVSADGAGPDDKLPGFGRPRPYGLAALFLY